MAPMAPHRDSPSIDPGPSAPPSSSRQPHPPPAAAKTFKRMFRSSLQETIRHVSGSGRKGDKGKEPESQTKGRTSTDTPPPSSFMEYLQRPSIFRRSAESQNKDVSLTDDGRKSTTPSVNSTTASGAERKPRVLRKHNSRIVTETPESTTSTHVVSRHRSSVPPPSQHPSAEPETGHSSPDSESVPGWGAFIPPTLSKGSMSSPALHALRDDDLLPDHDLPNPKSTTRHRSPLAAFGRLRKPSLILPPKSTVTPTPVHNTRTNAAPTAATPSVTKVRSSFEAPTKSSKSKIREAVTPAPLAISRPKPMVPPRSPSRLNGNGSSTNLSGRASSPQLNGNGASPSSPSSSPIPIPSSPKGSRIGIGFPSTSSRRLPGASASTSHLPSTINTNASMSNLNLNLPSTSELPLPALPPASPPPTRASLAKKNSVEVTAMGNGKTRRSFDNSNNNGNNVNGNASKRGAGMTGAAETSLPPIPPPSPIPQQREAQQQPQRRTSFEPGRRPSISVEAQRRPSISVEAQRMESPIPSTPSRRTSVDAVGRNKEKEREREGRVGRKEATKEKDGSKDKEPRSPSSSRTSNSESSSTTRAASPSRTTSSQPQPPVPPMPVPSSPSHSSTTTPSPSTPTPHTPTTPTPRRRTSSPMVSHAPPSPSPTPQTPSRPSRLLGRGIGSVSTSHLPLTSERSKSPVTPSSPTRLMPRRASHGQNTGIAPPNGRAGAESPASRTGTPTSPRSPTLPLSASLSNLSSSNSPSPQRDMLRKAGSILVRELVNKRSGWISSRRDNEVAEELDRRLGGLVRGEKLWGKSNAGGNGNGGANAGGGSLGGEERERRYFGEAVRDGYVLCQ
ncbi:hypothetical protein M422DRAFT_23836 [Sphaerobolus stellatus SS14]|nr:hypothetical protein M422DRAFT_23836 [Sphaerobolus stellatus SS14]